MQSKVKHKVAVASPVQSSLSFKHYLGAIFVAIILGLGIWYAQNAEAQSIVKGVISDPSVTLKSNSGRTNLLLLGIGGAGHEGSSLTDSMLLVSFDLSHNTAKIISIPRDIWIPALKTKINAAYSNSNEQSAGSGLAKIKSVVADFLGVPVDYALTLDFQGFVKAIDAVGGVDVQVQNTFDDYEYPIAGMEDAVPESLRYEHAHFDAGLTHMDGTTALKFARSRHALGDEGTDFARSARQQKIILAFRSKVLSLGTIFNSDTLAKLKGSVTSSIDTDISPSEQASFVKLALSLGGQDNIESLGLTDYLQNPKDLQTYGNQWVLIPTPSLTALQTYVKTQLAK